MTTRDDLIVTALRDWAREAGGDDHPSDVDLAAYSTGELSEADADRIAAHLTLCRDCAAIVLELTESDEGDADSEWSVVQERLTEIPATTPLPPPTPIHTHRQAGWARQVMSLVAALAGLVIGVSFGIGYGGANKAVHPASDGQVVTVEGAKRSAPAKRISEEVLPSVSRVMLLLPALASPAPRYRVEARSESLETAWDPWEAVPNRWGNVLFEVILREHGYGPFHVKLVPLGVDDAADLAFEVELLPPTATP